MRDHRRRRRTLIYVEAYVQLHGSSPRWLYDAIVHNAELVAGRSNQRHHRMSALRRGRDAFSGKVEGGIVLGFELEAEDCADPTSSLRQDMCAVVCSICGTQALTAASGRTPADSDVHETLVE